MSSVLSSMSVLTLNGFPFEDIQMSELEKRDRKYYIDYNLEGQPVFFQVNNVTLTGPTLCANETQCYLDVCVKDKFSMVADFFKEMDNFNKVSCFSNSEEWLGKHISMQDLDTVYRSSMTQQVIRLKIEKGALCTFDYKKNKIAFDGLDQGHVLDIIVELAGLKIMKNAFSANLILRQIRKHAELVPKIKTIPSEYLFLDKRHGDESLDSQTDIGTPMFGIKKNIAEDEEEEEEDDEEEEEEEDKKGKKGKKETNTANNEDNDEATQTENYVKSVETLKNLMTDYFSGGGGGGGGGGGSSATATAAVGGSKAKANKAFPKKERASEDNAVGVTPTILGSLLGETVASAPASAPPKKAAVPRKKGVAASAKKSAEPAIAAITAITAQLYKNI